MRDFIPGTSKYFGYFSFINEASSGQPFRLETPFFPFSLEEPTIFESTIFEEKLYNCYTKFEMTAKQVKESICCIYLFIWG